MRQGERMGDATQLKQEAGSLPLRARLREYARLMRLDRPVGTWLLLWPALWGLWISAAGNPDELVFVIFLVGTFVMRAAGCVVNDAERPAAAKKTFQSGTSPGRVFTESGGTAWKPTSFPAGSSSTQACPDASGGGLSTVTTSEWKLACSSGTALQRRQ